MIDEIEKILRPLDSNSNRPSSSGNRSRQSSPQSAPLGNLDLDQVRKFAGGMLSQSRSESDSLEQKKSSDQEATPDWLDALKKLNQSNSSSKPASKQRDNSPENKQRSDTVEKSKDDSKLSNLAKSLSDSRSFRDLTRNLRKTVREASEQAKERTHAASEDDQSGGFDWSRLAGAKTLIEESQESLIKSLKTKSSGKSTQSENVNVESTSKSKSSSTAKNLRKAFSPVRDFAKGANQLIMAGPEPNSSGSNFTSSNPTSVEMPQFSWLPTLLVVAAVCVLGYILLRQIQRKQKLELQDELRSMVFHLRTREDVIAAFHRVTANSNAVLGDWWPHQKAASAMANADPDKSETLETLVSVYERARYVPLDAELSPEEIESARQAINNYIAA